MLKYQATALLSCLLANWSPAQFIEYYHPREYEKVEGPERSAMPLGISHADPNQRIFRWQQVHDSVLPVSDVLRSFALRRDGTTRYDYSWCSVEMELLVSTSPVSAATAGTTFAANHGNDLTTLLPRSNVYFPTSLYTGGLPARMEFYLPCG